MARLKTNMIAVILALGILGTGQGIAAQPPSSASLPNFRVWLIETTLAKPEQFKDVIDDHLKYQFKLEREGIMFAAGPLLETHELDKKVMAGTTGLIAIRAASEEEARRIADADPMHSTGTRTYSLRQWVINEGAWDVTIRLSGQNPNTIK